MNIKFSTDKGSSIVKYIAGFSVKQIDYSFFMTDLIEAINNNTILIIRDTSGENVVNTTEDKKYLVKDFEVRLNEELGDSIFFQLEDQNTKKIESFSLKNIKKIVQNIGKKYYITLDNLKDDVLGFIFK